MGELQTCGHCGTQLDTSSMAPGQVLACGVCGTEQVFADRSGPASPAPPPRASARPGGRGRCSRSPRRGGEAPRAKDTAELADARIRIRAGKRCATSVYICIAAAPGWLVGGFVVSAVCGLVAAIVATWGLVELARVGPGPAPHEAPSGVVRMGSRLARSGKPKGVVGLSVGLALMALIVPALLIAQAKVEREKEQEQALFAGWEEQRARREQERVAFLWLDQHVSPHMRMRREVLSSTLPRAEIARRLHVFLETYPDSAGATFLLEPDPARRVAVAGGSEREPWITWRGILDETSAKSAEAALPAAVAALIEGVDSRRDEDAAAAIQALGEIGSPGADSAVSALERVRDGDHPDLQKLAAEALRRLRTE